MKKFHTERAILCQVGEGLPSVFECIETNDNIPMRLYPSMSEEWRLAFLGAFCCPAIVNNLRFYVYNIRDVASHCF